MNSLLQQLFHAPAFRRAILSAAHADGAAPQPGSLLYQLKTLFAFLQISRKKFYDTMPFCLSITDFDGQPLRLSEQKDANEFCNLLFDKLESELKGSSCASAVEGALR